MIYRHFEKFGLKLIIDQNIIPDDQTTLFVCSGMQRVKEKFIVPDKSKHASLQSCIRMNDLDLVGDGTHLTYFEMLGNFSFGNNDYELSIEMWHSLLLDLNIKVDNIHVHPTQLNHKVFWQKYGYDIIDDLECVWSDGDIGGYCCEVYSRGLEIGNLVNTLEHSTDVGFGWERLHLIVENKHRIQDTSLFIQHHPIVSDHMRTLEILYKNDIQPGNKGRNYVCKKLLRRIIPYLNGHEKFIFNEWLEDQKDKLVIALNRAKKMLRKHKDKSIEWWYETCGVFPEELKQIL